MQTYLLRDNEVFYYILLIAGLLGLVVASSLLASPDSVSLTDFLFETNDSTPPILRATRG